MKTNSISQKLLLALFFSTTGLFAQNANNPVLISGPKFAQPLIEKWISEYSKAKQGINIQFVTSNSKSATPQLNLVVASSTSNLSDNNVVFIEAGRYALLPVSNSKNPLLNAIGRKGLNKKDLSQLFFEPTDEELDSEQKSSKKLNATVYTAENKNKQAVALAKHFGRESSELKGKKVLGDEIYLLSALKKDSSGISYNNLNYLFDITSRKIKSDISILPLDLKKEIKAQLGGTIDDALAVLEKSQLESIPVGKIGFVYTQQNIPTEINDFLTWVLKEGQKYNHEQGFLILDNQDVIAAQRNIQEKLLTLK